MSRAWWRGTRDRKRVEVYEHWLELAREDDFVGVQNYERIVYGPTASCLPPPRTVAQRDGHARRAGLAPRRREYAYSVAGVPVLVSEHGVGTEDDTVRAGFIEPSLKGLKEAMDAGIPVLGYCHWTLMDNFEWIFGYGPKLGLHSVDRETFERTAKPSAGVYAELVREARGL